MPQILKLYFNGKELDKDNPGIFRMDFASSKEFSIEMENNSQIDEVVDPELILPLNPDTYEIIEMPKVIPPMSTKSMIIKFKSEPILAIASDFTQEKAKAVASSRIRYIKRRTVYF